MALGKGLRILRQDPWEMLLTFIISQRKSIPAIASAVEALAARWGEPLPAEREELFAFPTPEAMAGATEAELRACSLGYRAPYVLDAVRKVTGGEVDLAALGKMEDEALFRALQAIRGVGRKVAECVCLFGYGRLSRVPVDVWIERAIREECGGCEPFSAYGDDAGIMQQYVFYAMRKSRGSTGKKRDIENG
jgi:N-glycosylase/DNA lyase